MLKSIKKNQPAPLPTSISSFAKELVGMLLNKNPNERPDAEQLI
jgi:hypothetical protein